MVSGLTIGFGRVCYVSVTLYVCGFVLQGAAFQFHLHIAVLAVGWVLAQIATMMNTAAICEHPTTASILDLANAAK